MSCKYLSFEEARKFVRGLYLKNINEWMKYSSGDFLVKMPNNIPQRPDEVYQDYGWIDYNDWLGIEDDIYLEFKEARKFVQKLNLSSMKEWQLYCMGKLEDKGLKPSFIPNDPRSVYKFKGWSSIRDWLGINKKNEVQYTKPKISDTNTKNEFSNRLSKLNEILYIQDQSILELNEDLITKEDKLQKVLNSMIDKIDKVSKDFKG